MSINVINEINFRSYLILALNVLLEATLLNVTNCFN